MLYPAQTVKPSLKLRAYAYGLNIPRERRDLLLDRADELASMFAQKSDIEALARAIVHASKHKEETRFTCHAVDEILRRRFQYPYRSRALIFTSLSARCTEVMRSRQITPAPPFESRVGEAPQSCALPSATVLVVVVDSWLRNWCADTIRSIAWKVVTASDGVTALIELQRHDFDAIVCEFFLPAIDGDGVYAELAASNARSHLCRRFIFITGISNLSLPRITAFRNKTNAPFITVPCSGEALTDAISACLRNHEQDVEGESNIAETLASVLGAKQLCESAAKSVVIDLQEMTDLLFGEESGLANSWEEICVQRQGDESELWGIYEDTVCVLIEAHLEDLSVSARQTIWLATDEGIDWRCSDEPERGFEPPVCMSTVTKHIAGQYVYSRADQFSNDRITAFLSSRQLGE